MTEYLTEQEQIEILKNWIKQYSLVILAGVLIAIIAISGWRYWQDRQNKILSHASMVYDEMLTARAQNDIKNTAIQADKLSSHYSKTVYGDMAALMSSREAVIEKNYPQAKRHLQWVLDHSKNASLREIARLRFARILLAEQNPLKALQVLKKIEDKHFNGFIHEVEGDAYLAQQNVTKARQSYHQALLELPNAQEIRPLLQMKYDNLAHL